MQSKNKQKGMTGISIAGLLVVIGFVLLMFLKIMPIYFDSFKVGDVVSGIRRRTRTGK